MKKIRKMMKNKKGFTLIELMVVVIIVGILASVAVPLYTAHVKQAMASEGAALVGSIRTAERVYYAKHGAYTDGHDELGIDLTGNKYFKSIDNISIQVSGEGETATFTAIATADADTDAKDIVVSIDQNGNIYWSKDGTNPPTTPW